MKLATFVTMILFTIPTVTKSVLGRQIKTFYLNKKFDIRNPICEQCPNPECVVSYGSILPFPREMTVCFRIQPLSLVGSRKYMTTMSFGTLLPDWTDMDEGFVYGIWDTGPWLAQVGCTII